MKKWLVLLLLSFNSWLYAASPMTLTVNTQQPFSISLPANPTTGYHWELTQADKTALTLLKSQYLPSKSQLMGAGGHQVFTFKITQKNLAKTRLLFTYTRPWDKKQDSTQVVTVIFQAK